jgi:hypothetical protein
VSAQHGWLRAAASYTVLQAKGGVTEAARGVTESAVHASLRKRLNLSLHHAGTGGYVTLSVVVQDTLHSAAGAARAACGGQRPRRPAESDMPTGGGLACNRILGHRPHTNNIKTLSLLARRGGMQAAANSRALGGPTGAYERMKHYMQDG